ncbi:MAG: cytochrome c oxidase assembly protein [Pseudomonadota bacterium]
MADALEKRTSVLSAKLMLVVVGMFGFGYLLVPLYDIICDVTGLNGKTGIIDVQAAQDYAIDPNREVAVEFSATVNAGGSWRFKPEAASMRVKPGEQYTAWFVAENLVNTDVTGRAVPSVAPQPAAKYFDKTECFCFTNQLFEGGETKRMPVTFVVNPDLPINYESLVLSYTFFTYDG